jgi:glutamine amidotransferase
MKNKPRVAVIDYGVGNLFSVFKALERFNENIEIVNNKQSLDCIDSLILPGVGAFKTGMVGLEEIEMVDEIKKFAASGRPVLGICLGAQLLLSEGNEFGVYGGLDILPGKVEKIRCSTGIKVPHIGWNKINPATPGQWKSTILDNIKQGEYTYFVHSYACVPSDAKDVIAHTEYGGESFCSIFERGNVRGVQFHPEKSGSAGLRIIENFLNLDS